MGNIQRTIKQLRQELVTWKEVLETLVQENVTLKTKLAKALKEQKASNKFMEDAEYYMNLFTKQDKIIQLARHDVAELDHQLSGFQWEDDALPDPEFATKHTLLHQDMEKTQEEFNVIKLQFNTFLAPKP